MKWYDKTGMLRHQKVEDNISQRYNENNNYASKARNRSRADIMNTTK